MKYRLLEKGEIVKRGDEVDACNNGWKDNPKWEKANHRDIGEPAPDPRYIAHRIYRRKIK